MHTVAPIVGSRTAQFDTTAHSRGDGTGQQRSRGGNAVEQAGFLRCTIPPSVRLHALTRAATAGQHSVGYGSLKSRARFESRKVRMQAGVTLVENTEGAGSSDGEVELDVGSAEVGP